MTAPENYRFKGKDFRRINLSDQVLVFIFKGLLIFLFKAPILGLKIHEGLLNLSFFGLKIFKSALTRVWLLDHFDEL